MAGIVGIGHIQIYTNDLRKSIAFYETLGGKVSQYEDVHWTNRVIHMARVNLGVISIELSERYEFQQPDYSTLPCICHFCLEVDDLRAYVKTLRLKGIDSFDSYDVYEMDMWGGMTAIELRGPSNEKIELMQKK